jgi:uncharacterized protein (TIGR02001 family)
MKKALTAGVLAALTLTSAPSAFAADEEGAWGPFTAGVTLTSDYRFRGISQTDRDAAIQGWVQYDHASGFFANIWASNIDFNDTLTYDSNVEIDLTVGYNHAFSEQTSAGIKAVYYWYADADTPPGFPDYDYFELIANVSHDFGKASVSGELAWTPDNFGETNDAIALTGGVTVPLMDSFAFFDGGLAASGHVGYQWLDNSASLPDYLFYDLGVTATWGIFDVDLRWVGTDVSELQCGFTDVCEDGVVLSLTANLPG